MKVMQPLDYIKLFKVKSALKLSERKDYFENFFSFSVYRPDFSLFLQFRTEFERN